MALDEIKPNPNYKGTRAKDQPGPATLEPAYARPLLIFHQDLATLIWRTPQGWEYALLHETPDNPHKYEELVDSIQAPTWQIRADCEAAARYHLARLTWVSSDPDEHPLLVQLPEQQAKFREWVHERERNGKR